LGGLFAVVRTKGQAWDESEPLRAQAEWPEHAAFMDQLAANGFVVLGGPVGDNADVLLAVKAQDEEEIRRTLARDPWSTAGILDVKSIQPWTILLACQNPGLIPPS
jgi:uncharacterized protein YciI